MPLLSKSQGPEAIAWSVGGAPVNLEWSTCSMTAPGGYDRMSGKITGALQRRKLKQGATVVGTRPNGRVLYQGTIVSPPKIVNGVATIETEGHQAIIRRHNERLPYVIADASQWSGEDELPFDYAQHQKYTLQSKGDSIGWVITNATYATNNRAGYAIYVPGYGIQRLKMTLRKSGDNSDFDLEIRGADDLGSLSAITTRTLGAGNPDGTALNVNMASTSYNTLAVTVVYSAGGGAGTNDRFMLQDLTAYVIADDDDWETSDVVSDVAGRVNFADDVTPAGTEIGGLDWNGGWDELLNYMAAIEDWTWLVMEDRTKNGRPKDAQLTFRPWGNKTWKTSLNLIQENLTVAPLYNRVTVFYERPEGVPQHKTFDPDDYDLTDPIPGLAYQYPDPPRLENPQRHLRLVNNAGENLLRRVTKMRLVGSVKVSGLVKGVPFDIKAGDLLDIQDYTPKAGPQRISQVTWNADGTADVTLERSFDIAAMLFRLTATRRKTNPHSWGSGHRS